jgi:DNA-binding NtrC family response regulator
MPGQETITILIIDDDPNLRKTLSDILRAKGYTVSAARQADESFAMMKQNTFNVVLIDLKLPDMSGLEVLARIKAESPSTEAIIITGHATLESAIEATNKGAFSFIQKPYDVDQLMLHIRHAVEKQRAEATLKRELDEVERLNKLMIGRELKMEEMRARIRELEEKVARLESGDATGSGKKAHENR